MEFAGRILVVYLYGKSNAIGERDSIATHVFAA